MKQQLALVLVLSGLSISQACSDSRLPASRSDRFDVRDFGALGDGKTDDTRAFQKAPDAAGQRGGGVVLAPRGSYFFAGHLNVPTAVSLLGQWESVPAHNGLRDTGLPKPTDDGTTFLVTESAGRENGPAFVTLNTNSTLKGVVLYYPEQNAVDIPKPYPWAIAMRGKNAAVLAVEMLNPYNGIEAAQNERHLIRDVHGQPLRRGILVDAIYDIGRIENVHFNPWWSVKPKLLDWQMANGEAFIFGRSDWQYVLNTFCFGYKIGYKFVRTEAGVCNGNAETGVFMLLFLDLSYYDRIRQGRMKTFQDLKEAIIHGAVKRIRPKMMTVTAMFMGLIPIMRSLGTGSDVMKRIAAPMIGGVFTSFILELLVYPPIYAIWKWRYEMKQGSVDVSLLPVPHLRGH